MFYHKTAVYVTTLRSQPWKNVDCRRKFNLFYLLIYSL